MSEKIVLDGYNIEVKVSQRNEKTPGMARLLVDLFSEADLPRDTNYALGLDSIHGNAQRASKRLGGFQARNGQVRFWAQPGENNTARDVFLNVPRGMAAEALCKQLSEAADRLAAKDETPKTVVPKAPAVAPPVAPTRVEVLAKEETALQEEEARLAAKLAEANELLEPADLQLTHEEAKLEGLKRELTSLQAKITSCKNEVERLQRDRETAHELAGKAKADLEKCQKRLETVGAEKRRFMIEELDAQVTKSGATWIDLEVLASYLAKKAADTKKS